MDYVDGVAPVVTTFGPGNRYHLAYGSATLPSITGFVPTTNDNASHFLLGFSYSYPGLAFYWDGAGEAFFRLGSSTAIQAVGNSWTNSTGVPIVLGLNIASTAATAHSPGTFQWMIVSANEKKSYPIPKRPERRENPADDKLETKEGVICMQPARRSTQDDAEETAPAVAARDENKDAVAAA
ncbi:hypothetical protein FB45DRAFT_861202 [Roridomyces roridus]|uniref:Uncharacterized protein n=1 Tax=Roridomyces roridus TaxID=1738132 RepID=A0AAD7FU81_9AGAR|nr:hypothetical protein FB45DRAFT_861202 [Roridomyces roridus]